MLALPPYTAVVLAGGKAARLGGQAKPQLRVGGRTMLEAVLSAADDAVDRVVVGPRQPVPDGVLLVREAPPGGGPVAALRAGLAEVATEVVAVLAGDLPFLTGRLIGELRAALVDDGVFVVDGGNRDQYLLGVWRTVPLRTAVSRATGPTSLRKVLGPLAVHRLRPVVDADEPPPWLDCDTPADLARARAIADGHLPPPTPTPPPATAPAPPPVPGASLTPLFQEPSPRER